MWDGRDCYSRRGQRRNFRSILDAARIGKRIVHSAAVRGTSGTPTLGKLPAPASPAIIANEAVGVVRKTMNARVICIEALDVKSLQNCGY
jgi:hypothetical protein